MGIPAVMKVHFKELTVYPTNRQGNVDYNSDSKHTNRCVQIFKFYVAINIGTDPDQVDSAIHKLSKKNKKKPPKVSWYKKNLKISPAREKRNLESEVSEEYKRIKDADSYVVFPFDAIVYIRTVLKKKHKSPEDPQIFIRIQIAEPLIFLVNSQTMRYIASLSNALTVMDVAQNNLHIRPLDLPRENPKGWWKYAIRAVVEDLDRKKSLTQVSIQKWNKMMKYIALYKKKQSMVRG